MSVSPSGTVESMSTGDWLVPVEHVAHSAVSVPHASGPVTPSYVK